MIDEKVVNSLKNTLSFLDTLKSKKDEELREIIKNNNLGNENSQRKEMLETIFKHYVVGEDLLYYKKYLDFVRIKRVKALGDALDNLTLLTTNINEIYTERKLASERKNKAKKNIEEMDKVLREIPIIRAKIAFSHVNSSRDEFISTRTKDGMQRAKITDSITDVNKKGIIVRALGLRKVKKLQSQLKQHNISSIPKVEKSYDKFALSVKEYCDILRKLFYDLLDKEIARKRAFMSYKLVAGIGVNYDNEDLGIKEPSVDELANIDKEKIYSVFIDFADFPSAEELDSAMFFSKLKEFINYYDYTIAKRADYKISLANNKISKLFATQKGIVSSLALEKDYLVDNTILGDLSDSEDESYSLVFTDENSKGKKESV